MSAVIPVEQMMRYVNASAEQRAVIDRYLMSGNAQLLTPPRRTAQQPVEQAQYQFRPAGVVCDVVFNGSPVFHIKNTDGAKYLDHLLHRPNETIRAFDLEVAIKPYKAQVRETNTAQMTVDERTKREARAELLELETELAETEAEGKLDTVSRLESEIAQIKKLVGCDALLSGDTGERARDNVRKAVAKVVSKLRLGTKPEQAFAAHISESLSLGYDVVYLQPNGKIWK